MQFRQDALIYCIEVKSYDEQTMLLRHDPEEKLLPSSGQERSSVIFVENIST
ncbi:MAG: hypothetical protein IPK35_13990 [Saprospiraceae bacterium]|nr:hypothetical protein [Saprospiraceae bacterium]